MKRVLRLAEICLEAILAISAISHFNNQYRFFDSVLNYRILMGSSAEVLAVLLPYLEITTGTALISGLFRKGAVLIATVLFAMFLVAQVSALARGLKIDCGCFGDMGGLVSFTSVTIVFCLMMVSIGSLVSLFRVGIQQGEHLTGNTGLPELES